MADPKVDIVVTLRDKASKGLASLRGKMGKLGSAAGKVMKAGVLAGGVALAGLGVAAFKFGNDFIDAKNIIIAGTGASGAALEGLQDDFRRVFEAIPVDMDKAADAISQFNTLTGATGPALQNMAKNALEAARILGEDSAALIGAAGKAFNVFEISGDRANEVLDGVFAVSQATNVPMTKLLTTLQTYGPVLKNLGFGIAESTAFFGSLEKAGIDVSRVMPGLNAFMRKLSDEGVTDLKGALSDQIEQIRDAVTESEALNLATQAFGAEGAQRLSLAVRTGALDIQDLRDQMVDAGGKIAETAEATETWQDKLKRLRNRVLVKLEPVLVDLVEKVGEFAEWLEKKLPGAIDKTERFIRSIRPHVKRFMEIFETGLTVLRDALRPLVNFLLNNKAAMIAAITAIGVAILVALGPGAVAIAALIGLVTLIGIIKENWESIPGPIKKALEVARKIVVDKIDAIMGIIQGLIDFVKELVRFVKAIVRGDWAEAWDSLKNLAKIALNLFLDYLQLTFIGTIRSVLSALNVWDFVKVAFTTAKDNMIGAFNDAKNAILGAFQTVERELGIIWARISLFFTTAFDTMGSVIRAIINTVIVDPINLAIDALNAIPDVSIPFVGTIGVPHIDRIPRLEHGGRVVETGLAVVHKGEEFTRGGNQRNVIINGPITVVTSDPEDFIAQLRRLGASG